MVIYLARGRDNSFIFFIRASHERQSYSPFALFSAMKEQKASEASRSGTPDFRWAWKRAHRKLPSVALAPLDYDI